MQLPQVDSAVAIGRAHMPMVRDALACAPADAVGFVCGLTDTLGVDLMVEYAPASKRFGSRVISLVLVCALSMEDAQTLLRAPQHAGERDVLTRIARQLTAGRCVVFAGDAVRFSRRRPPPTKGFPDGSDSKNVRNFNARD